MAKERDRAATQDRVIPQNLSVRDLQPNPEKRQAPLAIEPVKAPKGI
jgi:hypothetical protein